MTGRRRRFGALRKLPSGRWQARYLSTTGMMVPADRTFSTKAEADRYLARVELDMQAGAWVDPSAGSVTVGEWATRWLDASQHLKPKTRSSYRSLLRSVLVPTVGTVQLKELRPMQVREWVAALSRRGYSPSRTRQAYRLLSQVMLAAQHDGLIVASPCVGVRLPSLPTHEPTILTPEQVDRLAAVMPGEYGLFVRFLAYTGLRFGEGAAVSWFSLDLETGSLAVTQSLSDADGVLTLEDPKNHQHRRVTLPGFLVAGLLRLRQSRAGVPTDLVFTSPTGLPLRHPNFMRRVWHPACKSLDLSAHPHDLRASHASWLYDMGWSPIEIAARLGHSNANVTTKHYARRIDGRDREIADGLDLLAADVSLSAGASLRPKRSIQEARKPL